MASESETRFTRGAWFNLALGLLIAVGTTTLLVHRFGLPTDGWEVRTPDDLSVAGLIYVQNIAGAPSGLLPGDRLVAVQGVPVDQLDFGSAAIIGWAPGRRLAYTILRSGQNLTLSVPVVHWTLGNWWRYGLFQVPGCPLCL